MKNPCITNVMQPVKATIKDYPCYTLKYCPYGGLVEGLKIRVPRTVLSCPVFGHDCPVFHYGEDTTYLDDPNVKKVK